MQYLYVLTGLPGSGKSTWAAEHVIRSKKCIVVNRDALRYMVKAGAYTYHKDLEPILEEAERAIIQPALVAGWNVIVDETNVTAEKRAEVLHCALNEIPPAVPRIKLICVVFRSDPASCLERRTRDARGVSRMKWQDVIEGMARDWEEPTTDEGFDEIITVIP